MIIYLKDISKHEMGIIPYNLLKGVKMTREQEIILLKLLFDRNNEVHNTAVNWLNDSLEELNRKRILEKKIK
jgi:hypothetical protein